MYLLVPQGPQPQPHQHVAPPPPPWPASLTADHQTITSQRLGKKRMGRMTRKMGGASDDCDMRHLGPRYVFFFKFFKCFLLTNFSYTYLGTVLLLMRTTAKKRIGRTMSKMGGPSDGCDARCLGPGRPGRCFFNFF